MKKPKVIDAETFSRICEAIGLDPAKAKGTDILDRLENDDEQEEDPEARFLRFDANEAIRNAVSRANAGASNFERACSKADQRFRRRVLELARTVKRNEFLADLARAKKQGYPAVARVLREHGRSASA